LESDGAANAELAEQGKTDIAQGPTDVAHVPTPSRTELLKRINSEWSVRMILFFESRRSIVKTSVFYSTGSVFSAVCHDWASVTTGNEIFSYT
jgi:hypothetical protein